MYDTFFTLLCDGMIGLRQCRSYAMMHWPCSNMLVLRGTHVVETYTQDVMFDGGTWYHTRCRYLLLRVYCSRDALAVFEQVDAWNPRG